MHTSHTTFQRAADIGHAGELDFISINGCGCAGKQSLVDLHLTIDDHLGHLYVSILHHNAHAILGFYPLGAHSHHRHNQYGIMLDVGQGKITVNIRNGSLLCAFHQDVCAYQRLVVIGRKHCSFNRCLSNCHIY